MQKKKLNKIKYFIPVFIFLLIINKIFFVSDYSINSIINKIDNQKLKNLENLHIVIIDKNILNSNLIGIRNLKNNKYKFVRYNYFTKEIYQNDLKKDDIIGNISTQDFIYKITSLEIRNLLIDSNNNFYIEPYSVKSPFLYKFKNNRLPEKYKLKLLKSEIIKIKNEWYIDKEYYKMYKEE